RISPNAIRTYSFIAGVQFSPPVVPGGTFGTQPHEGVSRRRLACRVAQLLTQPVQYAAFRDTHRSRRHGEGRGNVLGSLAIHGGAPESLQGPFRKVAPDQFQGAKKQGPLSGYIGCVAVLRRLREGKQRKTGLRIGTAGSLGFARHPTPVVEHLSLCDA